MTLEEIKAAIATNPALQKEIVIWAKDTEEGKELLNDFANAEFEKKYTEKKTEEFKAIEDSIFEVIGKKKAEGETMNDFLKGIAKNLKDLEGKGEEGEEVKKLKDEIKKLQETGEANTFWKSTHEAAVAKWEDEKKALLEESEKIKSDFNSTMADNDLKSGLNGLKFNESIPQAAIDAIINEHKRSIKTKIVDGKVVYCDDNGQPLLNSQYKAITPKEIWADKLKDFIAVEGSGTGGGAPVKGKPTITVVKDGEKDVKKLVLDKSQFSTKFEFNKVAEKALRELGIEKSSKDFADLKDAAYKEHQVETLELQ